MNKVILGALIASLLVVLTACGAGGEAVPATAQPLQVSGVVEGNLPADATVIEDTSSTDSSVVLARGTLGSSLNPRLSVTLADPDTVASLDLIEITGQLTSEGCTNVAVSPADARYDSLRGFSVFEDDGFRIVPDGYAYLTDAKDPNNFAAGETVYEYWLADKAVTVRGSCLGVTYNVDLAAGWNLVAVTLTSNTPDSRSATYRHVAAPPADTRWIWSTSAFFGLF